MNEKIKISVVTPVYNCKEYIEKCILSIKNQQYDNFEHIIVDGGSTDGTLEIIKKYSGTYNMRYISEKDNGMYDAIYKGFQMATGDVYAWLNADDMYMPWAFQVVENVLRHHPEVRWLTGIPSDCNEDDVCFKVAINLKPYHRQWIKKGYYDGRIIPRFIQQESVFFEKSLWDKQGAIIRDYDMAGDFHLWRKFAGETELYVVQTVISSFRTRKNQKSAEIDKYYSEIGRSTNRYIRYVFRNALLIYEQCFLHKDKKNILRFTNIMK